MFDTESGIPRWERRSREETGTAEDWIRRTSKPSGVLIDDDQEPENNLPVTGSYPCRKGN